MQGHNLESQMKKFLIIMLILSSLGALFIMISLGLPNWAGYCYWHLGLASCKDNSYIKGGPGDIHKLYDHICNDSEEKVFYESKCEDLCQNLDNFRSAGIIMIIFGVIAMCLQLGCAFYLALRLWKRNFNIRASKYLMLASAIIYMAAFFVYLIALEPNNIEKPDGPHTYKFKAEGGIYWAIALMFLLYIEYAASFLFIRKMDDIHKEVENLTQQLN